jgi:predicted amidohydrolase
MHIKFLRVGLVHEEKKRVYNVAAIVHNRQSINVYHKIFLPNYGVLDGRRYFDPKVCKLYEFSSSSG